MALLLWANLTGIALFIGIAFAAQLEAIRVAKSGPADALPEAVAEGAGRHQIHEPHVTAASNIALLSEARA